MRITYLGHSSFKLAGKGGTVVTDPYLGHIGLTMPSASADIVTVSHEHDDHNAVSQIKGTARRKKPFIVRVPGEYEVQMISVFGVASFHDDQEGVLRGQNTIFTIYIDGIRVCHLGDLGHLLTQEHIEAIGDIDVLLCPVGGALTIDAKQAAATVRQLDPALVIPMHYNTPELNQDVFGDLAPVSAFLSEMSAEVAPEAKLDISAQKLPEETEVVLLHASN